MKKILIALFVLPLFLACSSDSDNFNGTISIKNKNIVAYIGEPTEVDLEGDNLDMFDATIDNSFIASVMIYNEKLTITPLHVGKAKIRVFYKNVEEICDIEIKSASDFIGSTVTEFGITKEELRELVEKPYTSYFDDIQRGAHTYTYIINGNRVVNAYFINEEGLYGVEKEILSKDNDTNMLINISYSLFDYAKNLSFTQDYVTTSFPSYDRSKYVFSYPGKYFAVYEQKKYEEYAPGQRPDTSNYIYYAKEQEDAERHVFW